MPSSTLKISVVTAVYNAERTILDAIDSIGLQEFKNVEHIVIDGESTDSTSSILKNCNSIDKLVCEKDEGIYDAMNKGIRAATGDVIGFLHADDLLADPQSLQAIADAFVDDSVQAVYGDLTYVVFDDPSRVIRYWKSRDFYRPNFLRGWMPPHPTFYVRREIYERYGLYRTDLGSAADYECMLRLLYRYQIQSKYIPQILVKMRVGGQSNASLKNRFAANREDYRAWKENGFRPPFGLRITKPLSKITQFFRRPPKPN